MSLSSIFHAELPPMPRLGAPPGHMVPPAHVPILPPPARPLKHVLPVKDHTHILPGHRCPEYGYLPCASRLKFWVELQPRAQAAAEEAKVRHTTRAATSAWRLALTHACPCGVQAEGSRAAVRRACRTLCVPLPVDGERIPRCVRPPKGGAASISCRLGSRCGQVPVHAIHRQSTSARTTTQAHAIRRCSPLTSDLV